MSISKKEFNAKHGLLAGTDNDNYVQIVGGSSGNPAEILTQGTDTDIDLRIATAGAGRIILGDGSNTGIQIQGGIYDQTNSLGTSGLVLSSTESGLLWVPALQGTQGIQGIQGHQGLQGIQGVQGIQGIRGSQGLQGFQGHQGLQGLQGLQGVLGPQGIQGIQGFLGIQGIQGSQGSQIGRAHV